MKTSRWNHALVSGAIIAALIPIQASAVDSIKDSIHQCNQAIRAKNSESAFTISAALLKQNKQLAEAWLCQAKAFTLIEDAPQAENSLKQALQWQTVESERMVIMGLLGNAAMAQDKDDEALSHYQQANQLAVKLNIKSFQRVSHNLLGDVYSKKANVDMAFSQFQLALKLSQNDTERTDVLGRIAAMFFAAKQYDKAIEYQLQKLIASEKYGNVDEITEITLELGQYYGLNGDHAQAYKTLNKVMQSAQKQNNPYWQAIAHLYLANLDITTKQADSAKQHVQQAETLNQGLADEAIAQELNKVKAGLL